MALLLLWKTEAIARCDLDTRCNTPQVEMAPCDGLSARSACCRMYHKRFLDGATCDGCTNARRYVRASSDTYRPSSGRTLRVQPPSFCCHSHAVAIARSSGVRMPPSPHGAAGPAAAANRLQ